MAPESEDEPATPVEGAADNTNIDGKVARGAMSVLGGAIPFVGGFLSAAAAAWSEHEQEQVNRFFERWLKMMQAEFEEQQRTIIEIAQRLDMHDETIGERVASEEYQSLVRKAFRDWAGAESEDKRVLVRNVLSNAAASRIQSDDVVRLFLEWIKRYSELHFRVVGVIANEYGVTRRRVWEQIGKGAVREDSADADLFKLLYRDLSTGGIIRQHRDVDARGEFIKKTAPRRPAGVPGSRQMKSAFDDDEEYELTELGRHFVSYAMTEVPVKIAYQPQEKAEALNARSTVKRGS